MTYTLCEAIVAEGRIFRQQHIRNIAAAAEYFGQKLYEFRDRILMRTSWKVDFFWAQGGSCRMGRKGVDECNNVWSVNCNTLEVWCANERFLIRRQHPPYHFWVSTFYIRYGRI